MPESRRDARPRSRVWMMNAGLLALRGIGEIVSRASSVPRAPFLDPGRFAWVAELEASWEVLRDEAQVVLERFVDVPTLQDISPDQPNIGTDDRWRTFFLYGYGHRAHVNCAQCPRMTELVERVPGMITAIVSIMAPGKHIPPHRGPYAGFLRYHLGLSVPGRLGSCRLRVGDEWQAWEEGRSLIFDDTYEHEAINGADAPRMVLIIDFARPLGSPFDRANKAILDLIGTSPMVRDGLRNQEMWQARWLAGARQRPK